MEGIFNAGKYDWALFVGHLVLEKILRAHWDGYIFDIITFRTADGCSEEGRPTLEFTWFKIIHGPLHYAAGAEFTLVGNIQVIRLRRILFMVKLNPGLLRIGAFN